MVFRVQNEPGEQTVTWDQVPLGCRWLEKCLICGLYLHLFKYILEKRDYIVGMKNRVNESMEIK